MLGSAVVASASPPMQASEICFQMNLPDRKEPYAVQRQAPASSGPLIADRSASKSAEARACHALQVSAQLVGLFASVLVLQALEGYVNRPSLFIGSWVIAESLHLGLRRALLRCCHASFSRLTWPLNRYIQALCEQNIDQFFL